MVRPSSCHGEDFGCCACVEGSEKNRQILHRECSGFKSAMILWLWTELFRIPVRYEVLVSTSLLQWNTITMARVLPSHLACAQWDTSFQLKFVLNSWWRIRWDGRSIPQRAKTAGSVRCWVRRYEETFCDGWNRSTLEYMEHARCESTEVHVTWCQLQYFKCRCKDVTLPGYRTNVLLESWNLLRLFGYTTRRDKDTDTDTNAK